jgi:hypothetical protein
VYRPTTVITPNPTGPIILLVSTLSSVGKIKAGRAVRDATTTVQDDLDKVQGNLNPSF